jgi:DNA-directed RNA polymerase subunit L
MKINITKQENMIIEMDFSGEGHTLLNLIQSSLLEDSNVEMAGYTKPHPLMDRSKLFIQLKKKENPLEVIKRASMKANGKLDEFLEVFNKSVQDFKE